MSNNEKHERKLSNERIVSDSTVFNRSNTKGCNFKTGQKMLLQTDDYVGEFRVVDESDDQGTDFRTIVSSSNNVIVELHYLQREYTKGNIKLIDAEGKIIDNS